MVTSWWKVLAKTAASQIDWLPRDCCQPRGERQFRHLFHSAKVFSSKEVSGAEYQQKCPLLIGNLRWELLHRAQCVVHGAERFRKVPKLLKGVQNLNEFKNYRGRSEGLRRVVLCERPPPFSSAGDIKIRKHSKPSPGSTSVLFD